MIAEKGKEVEAEKTRGYNSVIPKIIKVMERYRGKEKIHGEENANSRLLELQQNRRKGEKGT